MFASIFFVLWFFTPAGFANLAAFISGKIKVLKKLNYPVDCYIKFHGKRVLGSHKTIRGFIVAIVVGVVICYIQTVLYHTFSGIRALVWLNYDMVNPVIFGALLGFGALTGDAVKSFFKRQAGIQPGMSWFPFDQVDYIIGGVILSLFYIHLSIVDYVVLFIVWFLVHPLMTFLGYFFKLRRRPL
ncbi:MAG TPA: CDP-archaeol synthase [Candidatus Sulfotelmatobacter sp.]|jgi:CDP-2,3-bis-(O-geranylgeranyl)-sn-glycerol synthase|nr:CDP-archaeol synthase [Candidatus Sulfotelmatobacter sp.]